MRLASPSLRCPPNQYKNILGILPKEWRVPLTIRRERKKEEMLVRLQNITPAEKSPSSASSSSPG